VNGRVIYAVPESPAPLGGVRVLHRHVELLVKAGVDAYVWLPAPGYRYEWFDSPAPRLFGPQLELTERDLLAVPEGVLRPGGDPAPGARKVIINQNHFLTYLQFGAEDDYPDWSAVAGAWVVSEDSADVLSRAEPEIPVSLIPNPLDLDLFRPAGSRVRRIAWMPRKRPLEAMVLERLLRRDPRSAGVELTPLEGLPETEVARILGETSVFVALGLFEGFGLPIAEALASGCLVVGYGAGGGRELFGAPGTWQVADQRTTLLADRALSLLDGTPDEESMRLAAREWIAGRYTAGVTAAALLEAVETAMAYPGAAVTARHPADMDNVDRDAMQRVFMKGFGMPAMPTG